MRNVGQSDCTMASHGQRDQNGLSESQSRPRDSSPSSKEPFALSSNDSLLHDDTDAHSNKSSHMSQESLSNSTKLLVFHSFLSFVICSMDRINIAVAIIPMSEQFGWNHSRQGIIQSIFFLGYMFTMIPGGRLADSRGGRIILAGGVIVWSIATALIPPFAPYFALLLLARVLLGAGEGVAMPSMNALIAAAVPSSFRARSLAFIYSGMYAGSILGLIGTPILLRFFGYPGVFYISAAIGLIWAFIFLMTTKNPSFQSNVPESNAASLDILAAPPAPAMPPVISKSENSSAALLDHIEYGVSSEGESRPGVIHMLTHRAVWAIVVAQFCCTWGYFVLLAWMPTYLHLEHNLDISSSAILSTLPWLSMFTFANLGGTIADGLLSRGLEVTSVRKIMQGIGFIGPSISLLTLMILNNLVCAVILMALALATSSFSQSGVYANHQDIGPRDAGTLLGISSTFASVPGLIGVWITGVILDVTQRDWNAVFALSVFFYTFGLLFYTGFGTSEQIW